MCKIMAQRKRSNQSEHDRCVREHANKLKKSGYSVKADIPGFKKPTPIGKDKRIPDIEATKGNRRKLIEVETKSSLHTDKQQQSTFRRSAAQRKGTTFQIEMPKKKRR
jgi:hypothetical protein